MATQPSAQAVPIERLVVTMFGGERRRGAQETEDARLFAQLDRIRRHVVEPIVSEIQAELKSVRRELVEQGERFERSQVQMERAQEQTAALIRNLTDPVTGAITRAEMSMLRDTSEKVHEDLARNERVLGERVMAMESLQPAERFRDHEERLRRREAPVNLVGVVTAIAGVMAIMLAIVALGGHLVLK